MKHNLDILNNGGEKVTEDDILNFIGNEPLNFLTNKNKFSKYKNLSGVEIRIFNDINEIKKLSSSTYPIDYFYKPVLSRLKRNNIKGLYFLNLKMMENLEFTNKNTFLSNNFEVRFIKLLYILNFN